MRESLPNSVDTENNLNNTIIKSRSSDDIKLDLDGLEILKIVGPETYNYKYNVAVQVEDKNGPSWFIMDGEGKKYNTKFSDIKVAENGFSFTMDVLPGAYISGIIDEKEPVGFKEVLLTTEGFVRFNGCFPIQCIKGCGGIKYNDKEGPFVIDTLVDKKVIEYCGVLSPKGQIDDKLIVRTIKSCDVVTDSWELQLDAARAIEMVENERKELSKINPFLGKGGKNNIAISNIDETILDSSGEALEEIKGQEGYRFFKDGQIIGIKDRQGNNRPYVFDANSNEIIKLKNIGDLESGTRYRRSVNSDVAELLMKMNFLKKEKSFIVGNHKVTFLLDLNDRSECVGAVLNTRYSVDFSKPGVEQHAYPDLLGPSVCFVPIVKVVGFNPKEIPIGFEAVENGIGISLNAQVDNDFNLKGKCTATATSCKRVASSKHPKITDKMLKEWAKIIVSNLEEVINLDILDPASKEMAKKGNKGFKSKLLNAFRRIKR